jgi:hypothetical protein
MEYFGRRAKGHQDALAKLATDIDEQKTNIFV